MAKRIAHIILAIGLALPAASFAQVMNLNQIASSTQSIPYFGILMGDGTGSHKATASSTPSIFRLIATSTSIASVLPLASTTVLSATTFCLTGDTCRTTWPTGSVVDSFTHTSVYGQTTSASSTLLALTGSPFSLVASSTVNFVNASTTQLTISGGSWLGTPLALVLTNATGLPLSTGITGTLALANGGSATTTWNNTGGLLYYDGTTFSNTSTFSFSTSGEKLTLTNASSTLLTASTELYTALASTTNLTISATPSGVLITSVTGAVSAVGAQTCTNQFFRSLSAAHVVTCATVGAADVSLAALTAGTTLTSAGTYTGATARTFDIDLTHANSWTALQTFSSASTSALSCLSNCGFGSTATSSFASTGALTLATQLTVPNGGSGAVSLTGMLQGNGASAFTAISDSSTVGQVLRVTGSSTYAWGALNLASANAVTGTLATGNGGTGTSTPATYGNVLTWNGSNYQGVATSSLGITTFGVSANLMATSSNQISTTSEDFIGIRVPVNATITQFNCYARSTGTSTVRATVASNPLAAGTDILYTSGVQCGSQVYSSTSTFGATAVAAGSVIRFYVSDASPTGSRPNAVYPSFTLTKN